MASSGGFARLNGVSFAGGAALQLFSGRHRLRRLRAPVCRADGPRASGASDAEPPQPAETPVETPAQAVPPRDRRSDEDETADVGDSYSLSETLKESPRLNSWKMNAMRDYFGDDGREVEKYTKRARNASGAPMFRVLVIGSGDRELIVAKRLAKSDVVVAVYYCPDEPAVCEVEFAPYATSTGFSATEEPSEVTRFAAWALVDAVFVGPDRPDAVGKETETALAEAGVTLFSWDVSAMVAEGEMGAEECLAALAESAEPMTAEQLVE